MRDRAKLVILRVRKLLRGAAQRSLSARVGATSRAALSRTALLAALALAVLALSAADANANTLPTHAQRAAAHPQRAVLPLSGQKTDATLDTPPPAGPPVICVPLPDGSRMWTPAQLANPRVPGLAYDEQGRVRRCEWNGLEVPQPAVGTPSLPGQVILVSLSQQWLWAYQDGRLVFANPITSGRPGLATPPGDYHVQAKVADTTFYSPWGPWSPYYYTPEHVNYALLFRTGGYFLHDAPWREMFGPGSNVPHSAPSGASETGSHGCVNMTTAAAEWLYHWASIGATVLIVA